MTGAPEQDFPDFAELRTLDTCSVTELSRHASQVIARAATTRRPIVITRWGRPVAVLIDIKTWRRMSEPPALDPFTPERARQAPQQALERTD